MSAVQVLEQMFLDVGSKVAVHRVAQNVEEGIVTFAAFLGVQSRDVLDESLSVVERIAALERRHSWLLHIVAVKCAAMLNLPTHTEDQKRLTLPDTLLGCSTKIGKVINFQQKPGLFEHFQEILTFLGIDSHRAFQFEDF